MAMLNNQRVYIYIFWAIIRGISDLFDLFETCLKMCAISGMFLHKKKPKYPEYIYIHNPLYHHYYPTE